MKNMHLTVIIVLLKYMSSSTGYIAYFQIGVFSKKDFYPFL